MARLNKTRTIILLIIFCVLGAYVLWSPPGGGDSGQQSTDDQDMLPVSLEALSGIAVQYKKQRPAMIFAQKEGVWFMTQPRQAEANQDHVRDLLAIFKYGYVEMVGQETLNLADYGLDQPEIVLTLTSPTVKTRVIFGPDSPSKAVCYCQMQGDPRIFTVGVLYKKELEKSVAYYLRPNQ